MTSILPPLHPSLKFNLFSQGPFLWAWLLGSSLSSKKGTILKSLHSVKKPATTMGGAQQSRRPARKMRSAETSRSMGCFGILSKKALRLCEWEEDLKKGIIRAIGNPHERFLDDRLRMMRAVRYSTRFDFPIEPNHSRPLSIILRPSSRRCHGADLARI